MRILKETASWTGCIVGAVAIALLINIFVIQPTQVEGRSMEPTLHDGDRVLVSKLPHTFSQLPDYGEIVIIDNRVHTAHTLLTDIRDTLQNNLLTTKLLRKPQEETYWIKRVIGRPGDRLEYQDGKLMRNGEVVEETYIKEPMRYFPEGGVVVPSGHIYVMGDNRNQSGDSRYIGSIPLSHVVGKYVVRF